MTNGDNVIGDDPWGPPRVEPLPAGGTWGPSPHDIAPSPLRIYMDMFACQHALNPWVLVRVVNGVLAIMRRSTKGCISLAQAMAYMSHEGLNKSQSKAIWAALAGLIPIGEYGRIGMESVYMYQEG